MGLLLAVEDAISFAISFFSCSLLNLLLLIVEVRPLLLFVDSLFSLVGIAVEGDVIELILSFCWIGWFNWAVSIWILRMLRFWCEIWFLFKTTWLWLLHELSLLLLFIATTLLLFCELWEDECFVSTLILSSSSS